MPLRVTFESSIVDPAVVEVLWRVYDSSMGALQADSISKVSVERTEFEEHLAMATTHKWVAWDGDLPVGILAVDTDIRHSAWLESAFLEAHLGDALERGAVFYLVLLSVDEAYRRSSAARSLVGGAVKRYRLSGVTVIMDTHAANVASMDLVVHLVRRLAPLNRRVLDVVTYSALEFPAVIDLTDTAVRRVRRRSAEVVDVTDGVERPGEVGEEISG